MFHSNMRLGPQKGYSVFLRLIKIITGLFFVIIVSSLHHSSSQVFAQSNDHTFPGKPIFTGQWEVGDALVELNSMGPYRLLERTSTSGNYRIWHYDPYLVGGSAGPFSTTPEGKGDGRSTQMTYLGNEKIFSWDSESGEYKVQRYGLSAERTPQVLSAQPLVQGTLPKSESEIRFIHLGNSRVLEWEVDTGKYKVWHYASTLVGAQSSFPGQLIAQGTWPTIRTGHELVYLGYRRILDWEPETGQYRIWRYDPMITGDANPLVGEPVFAGSWGDTRRGHQLMTLGNNHLLDWDPVRRQYEIFEFDLNSLGILSVDDLSEKFTDRTITGVTPIIHGRQIFDSDGDNLLLLAEDIHDKIGGWLIDHNIDGNGNSFFECTNDCDQPGEKGANEVILLFDWAPGSNEASSGWGEAAGDALFNLLVKINLAKPTSTSNPFYHFIAHSFGTAVTGEVVERLAYFNIPVDHVTLLDPHDFDQELLDFDGDQKLFDLGKPTGYGATIWKNVIFADVYYQTRGESGNADFLVPNGRPIPGAFNELLLSELPDPSDYPFFDPDNPPYPNLFSDHSYVWFCFYRATVTGSLPSNIERCPPAVVNPDYSQTGYAFSRVNNPAQRPDPNFYTDQAHAYSEPKIVDIVTGDPNTSGLEKLGLESDDIVQGRWEPDWSPTQIANGKVEPLNQSRVDGLIANPVCRVSALENTCPQPGWYFHGGGGWANFARTGENGYLVLDFENTTHRHNWIYIPADATKIKFDLNRKDGLISSNYTFDVLINDQVVASYIRDNIEKEFTTQFISIPDQFLGQVVTITFRFSSAIAWWDRATLWIDNLEINTKPIYLAHLPLMVKEN